MQFFFSFFITYNLIFCEFQVLICADKKSKGVKEVSDYLVVYLPVFQDYKIPPGGNGQHLEGFPSS